MDALAVLTDGKVLDLEERHVLLRIRVVKLQRRFCFLG
jgi:hypothetical protein